MEINSCIYRQLYQAAEFKLRQPSFIKQSKGEFNTIRHRTANNHDHRKSCGTVPIAEQEECHTHTFRHSAAMNLLQAGVDISTIAIWLGHESIETTHKYVVADIEIKRKAMEKLDETSNSSFNYKPSKSILAFLASL